MLRVLLVVLSLSCLTVPAHAQTRTFECSIKGTQARSWIQSLIFIAYDASSDRVVVSDPAILQFNGGQPVEGSLVTENARRITFKWSVDMVSASKQRLTMNYRATYVKGTGAVNVTAQPKHFSNIFNAGGTCKVGQLK